LTDIHDQGRCPGEDVHHGGHGTRRAQEVSSAPVVHAAFKAEIVQLCQPGDRSIGQVTRDFELTETAVREWVRQAERDADTHGDGGLTSQERQELAGLRRENRRLREDVEILKRATAFFVTETR
jgi:transposase